MSCSIESDTNVAFEIILDVQHFVKDQIKVTIEDHKILVETRHGVTKDNSYESRHSVRSYPLPVECDDKSVTSELRPNGMLHIKAYKKM